MALPCWQGAWTRWSSGDLLVFRHDLVREVICGEIPLPVRQALHRDLAARLEGIASAGQVARHLMLGARPGDPAAVDPCEQHTGDIADRHAVGARTLSVTMP